MQTLLITSSICKPVVKGSKEFNFKLSVEINGANKKINSISIFKNGIKPMWEDQANKNGGEFNFRQEASNKSDLLDTWKKLVFSVIGGTIDFSDKVIRGILHIFEGVFL